MRNRRPGRRRGRRRAARGHVRGDPSPGAGRRRDVRRRARRAGHAPPLDHRPRGRRPADRKRGRHRPDRLQRRDLQLPRAPRASSRRSGHRSRRTATPKCSSTSTKTVGPRRRQPLRGMFALALWDAPRRRSLLARDRFGIKPLSYWARPAAASLFASELRCSPARSSPPSSTKRRSAGYLAFNYIPDPHSIFARHAQAPARPPARLDAKRGAARRAVRPAQAGRRRCRPHGEPSPSSRPSSCERLRDAVRSHLVSEVPLGAFLSGGSIFRRRGDHGAGGTERSRPSRSGSRCLVQRARRRSHGGERSGTDHTSSSSTLTADALLRRVVPPSTSRSPTPRRCRPTSSRELARRRASRSRSAGRRRRRAVRRLHAYAADLLAPRIGPLAHRLLPLVERLPSSSARASFDYKAKRFARAAHLPPLERHHGWKEIFSADARAELVAAGAACTWDPVGVLRARYDETVGCRGAGPASGRRPRRLPRRRPPREDRPREHGALARGAGALPRHRGRRARAGAPHPYEGPRASQRSDCSGGP